jgi:hypothetical protein
VSQQAEDHFERAYEVGYAPDEDDSLPQTDKAATHGCTRPEAEADSLNDSLAENLGARAGATRTQLLMVAKTSQRLNAISRNHTFLGTPTEFSGISSMVVAFPAWHCVPSAQGVPQCTRPRLPRK